MPRFTFENKFTFGNLISIVIMVLGGASVYFTLANTVATSADAVKTIPPLESRVTTIEARIGAGQQARTEFQVDMKEALKDSQAATNKRLDRIDDTLASLSATVATLNGTIQAMKQGK